MELKEIYAILISSGITIMSIIFVYLLNIIIKNIAAKRGKKIETLKINEIVNLVMDAENILGKGQGAAKLAYVLQKLNLKQTDKKAIKKINEVHSILKTAKNNIIENKEGNK